jgi:hypothetical protein
LLRIVLPLGAGDVVFNKDDHGVEHIVANQLRNAVQTDTCGLLHACFIVFVVVIVDGDLNHVLEHEINQIFVVLPNMSLAWLLLLLASDFDFCERGPELDSLQTH